MNDPTITQLTTTIIALAKEKGFGAAPAEISVPEKIALIHSEVSEAFEAYRHKNIDGKDGFKEELADVIIRVLHLAGALGFDMSAEISKKMEFNKMRTWDWKNLNEESKQ